MSRNSKNRRLHEQARQISASRKAGNKGPKATSAVHGKVRVQWKRDEIKQARQARINAGKTKKTIAEKIKAGDSMAA